jgi:nucleotide-binding universal stress UspA family protein
MFKNVLVGVDGRSTGRDAIALAAKLVDPAGELTLANVRNDVLNPLHAAAPDVIATEREMSHKLLERERSETGVSAKLMSLVSMSAGGGLHRQAEQQGADLLVVGSCSHGTIGRAMLGNDTRAALNGASCAVAIASRGYADHPALSEIGVGYDDSPESRAALEIAQGVAARSGADPRALEVVPISTYSGFGVVPAIVGSDVEELLADANARLSKLPGVLEAHAVYGLAGEELASFSGELDLLVVGSRGYGPVRRLVLGSTSSYLERHARCSLLVLPRVAVSQTTDDESSAEAPWSLSSKA